MKRVCLFGIYDKDYSRTRVLRRALEENGCEIIECHVDPRIHPGFRKFSALYKEFKKIKEGKFDYVFVCFPGHSVVWLARILFGKDIIFDAFLSLYDSNVYDRKMYSLFHPMSWYDWLLDWSSCFVSRLILLDTNEHIKYFHKTFFVGEEKMLRFLISADEEVFRPLAKNNPSPTFLVHFHGMFIPLQGVKYILDAASVLRDKDILFRIIGAGQEYKEMISYAQKLSLKNIEFVGKVPMEGVPAYMGESDICLGIFGSTEKAKRVIPNKVYEGAAMGKTVITGFTPAICEVFRDQENVILCALADGKAIAEAIESVRAMADMGLSIGQNARRLFVEHLRAKVIGEQLLIDIRNGKA